VAILKELEDGTSPDQVCTSLDLCSSKKILTTPPVTPPKQDSYCSLCEYTVQLAELAIETGALNDTDIINQLNAICALLGDFESECETFVDQYADAILKELQSGTPPEQVCTSLDLCSSKKILITRPKQDTYCTLCEYTVQLFELALKTGVINESLILSQLDAICQFFPSGQDQQACEDYVTNYAGSILTELEDGTSPDTVCNQVGLCSSKIPVYVFIPQQDSYCSLCEYTVQLVELGLQSGGVNASEIIDDLNAICQFFPSGQLQQECDDFVTNYATSIISELEDGTSPDTVCNQLGLCTSVDIVPIQIIA